jgi:hypothetical protein
MTDYFAMRKFLNRYIDWVVITVCIAAMVLFFEAPHLERGWVIGGIGAVGVAYILYISWLWLFRRVSFDWHLINGHFLRKVVCVVVLLPFVVTAVLYLLGWCGCEISARNLFGEQPQPEQSLLWSVYYHFVDPGNQHNASSSMYSGVVALIAILGVFLLNGLLVSSIVGWIDRRKEQWLKGEISYYEFLQHTPHDVIIGGSDVVVGLVRQLFDVQRGNGDTNRGYKPWIVIQTSGDVEALRRELSSVLSCDEQRRMILRYGECTSAQDVGELALESTRNLFIVGEQARTDDVESNHDTLNMESLKVVSLLCSGDEFKRGKELPAKIACYVMFEYQTAYAALKVSDVDGSNIAFYPFNLYEMQAQCLLAGMDGQSECDGCQPEPLEGWSGIREDEESFVHLIIVGMSRVGVALGVETAHLAHYPNFETRGVRTRITFIDKNVGQELSFFKGRFKWLFELSHWRYAKSGVDASGNKTDNVPLYVPSSDNSWHKPDAEKYAHLGGDFLDVEWEFIDGSVESDEVRKYLSDAVCNPCGKVTIAVCLPEPNRAVASALYMPSEVYDKVHQVLVYQRCNDSMLREISQSNPLFRHKLKPFGIAAHSFDFRTMGYVSTIAQEINSAYDRHDAEFRELQQSRGVVMPANGGAGSNTNGKAKSAKLWSNRYNAYSMWSKLRCVGISMENYGEFTPEQLDILARVEHNRWNMEQLLLGFRPLSAEEQALCRVEDRFAKDYYELQAKKNALKGSEYAHLDICSNERLHQVDDGSADIDKALVAVLPKCLHKISNPTK